MIRSMRDILDTLLEAAGPSSGPLSIGTVEFGSCSWGGGGSCSVPTRPHGCCTMTRSSLQWSRSGIAYNSYEDLQTSTHCNA